MPDDVRRPTLLIFLGTFLRTVYHNLGHLIDGGGQTERLQVICADADETNSHPNRAAPLFPNGQKELASNSFVRLDLPPEDYRKSVLQGERGGEADALSPEVLRKMVSNQGQGAGGQVVAGSLLGRLNGQRVQGKVRRCLQQITDATEEVANENGAEVRVLIAAGCFGAHGGAIEEVRHAVEKEATDLGHNAEFERLVSFPGNHPSRDMEQSQANSLSFLREQAARSTGRYVWLRPNRETGDWEPSLAPTVEASFLESDKNNAPRTASTCGTKEFASLMAHVLALRITSPFGSRLDGDLIDFADDAQGYNKHGERRMVRSIGLSTVSLNRDRIRSYATERLSSRAWRLLQGRAPAPSEGEGPDEVEREARDFLTRESLLEGEGYEDLSRHLRSEGTIEGLRPQDRFESVLERQLGDLEEGIERLQGAPDCRRMAEQQLEDDWEDALRRAAEAKQSDSEEALRQFIEGKVWDLDSGVLYARELSDELATHLEAMIEKAEEANRERADRIEEQERALREIEDEGIGKFEEMNGFQRWMNQDQIQTLADRYLRRSTALLSARVNHAAGLKAVSILESLHDLAQDLHAKLTSAASWLDQAIDEATDEIDRIVEWNGVLDNPNGVRLGAAESDLEAFYFRALQREGEGDQEDEDLTEQNAARELIRRLEADGGPSFLELVSEEDPETGGDETDGDRIEEYIRTQARGRVEPSVGNFHVQEELLRRYPDGANGDLQGFLRARDRDAYERIRLTDLTDRDDGEQVLRYLCGDDRHGQKLTGALNESAQPRDNGEATYDFVDTGDSERLYVVQVRVSVPPGQVADLSTLRSAYRSRSQDQFETLHTEPVGRHLPKLRGKEAKQDKQRALVKAYALGALSEGRPLTYHTFEGEEENLLQKLESKQNFDVRTEISTRFFCAYRLKGPEPLRSRLDALEEKLEAETSPDAPVLDALTEEVSDEAIGDVREQISWYETNTVHQSALWNSSP